HSDMSWSQGYYSARTNLVALADPDHHSRRGTGLRILDAGSGAASITFASASEDAVPSLHHAGARRTTHEVAHQLAFDSGLQRRGVMYPLWVAEGLATTFEVEVGGVMGPGQDNPVRRHRLEEAYASSSLLPIETLI